MHAAGQPHKKPSLRDLFRLLHAVWHGTEAPVYSDHLRDAAASTCLAITYGLIISGEASLLHLQRCQCSSRISAAIIPVSCKKHSLNHDMITAAKQVLLHSQLQW